MSDDYKQQIKIPTLKGTENYQIWAINTRLALEAYNLWQYAEGTALKPSKENKEDLAKWVIGDARAKHTVFSSTLVTVQRVLEQHLTTARELWDAAKKQYSQKGYSLVKQSVVRMYELKVKDFASVEEYNNNFAAVFKDLLKVKETRLGNNLIAVMYLQGLARRYKVFVSRKESEARLGAPSISNLMADAIEESQNQDDTAGLANALVTKGDRTKPQRSHTKKEKCKGCKRGFHAVSECWREHPEKAPNWWKRPKGNDGKPKNAGESFSSVVIADSSNDVTKQTALIASNPLHAEWVIDTGTTDHMCNNLSIFTTHKPLNNYKIRQASGQIAAEAVGTVKLDWKHPDGTTHTITMTDVLYVPELFTNLLSAMKMRSRGVKFDSGDGVLYHMASNQAVGYTTQQYGHWLLCCSQIEPRTVLLTTAAMWHRRLGHPSSDVLHKTVKATSGANVTEEDNDKRTCKVCELSKSHRQINHEHQESAKNPFELVYADVMGHITPTAATGDRWVLQLVDSATRACWAYPMKQKGEAANRLVEYMEYINKNTDRYVRRIRLDGGREFNHAIQRLAECGTTVELMAPYTPKQNGVAERANGTLATRTRALMVEGKLPARL